MSMLYSRLVELGSALKSVFAARLGGGGVYIGETYSTAAGYRNIYVTCQT